MTTDPETGPFFNAHCHLELSHLKGKLPAGLPFVEWLEGVVRLKRATLPEESAAAAKIALEEMISSGTRVLFDVLSMDTTETALLSASDKDPRFQALLFRELLAFDSSTSETQVEQLRLRCGDILPEGISPHSPYTVHPALLSAAGAVSLQTGKWLCIHAAETAEETQMLLHGQGPLRDFLAPFLPLGWEPPRLRPIEYLDSLGCLGKRTLLVHCNHASDSDLELIRKRGSSVVVCPGTHVYFGRGDFPLLRLLERGIPAYIGTDSLASNTMLDMRRELEIAGNLCNNEIQFCKLLALADTTRANLFLS